MHKAFPDNIEEVSYWMKMVKVSDFEADEDTNDDKG